MDYNKAALKMHEENKGKIGVVSKVAVKTRDDLSTAYTPGVAEPCRKIRDDKKEVYRYTAKGNLVAVVSDGTAVLGLGEIGPEAAMPVMEGKSILFKEFAGIDAFPICLDTKDTEEIIETVKRIAPVFGGINLEDISAPRCFEIESRLKKELDIPVFHDDQHGTAIVVSAGLLNAVKFVGKKMEDVKIVINGARVVATGRSDFPNQINNVLVFPGVFRGALDAQATDITEEMKIAAVYAIADIIKEDELNEEYIIPGAFDERVASHVAEAVAAKAKELGISKL